MALHHNGTAALARLHEVITTLVDLPADEWKAFASHLRTAIFAPKTPLYEIGVPIKAFYFLLQGLVRLYYLTSDGKEFNKAFRKERDFLGAFSVDEKSGGALFAAETLETTEVVILPTALLAEFAVRHAAWQELGRLQAERVAREKTRREASLMLDSARARYEQFLIDYPDLSNRLPLYHIASYLGITDVALSRIRRRIRET